MTEAELWHMHLLAVENTVVSLEGAITIFFAYLATAHFVGPRLTRFQAILVSCFFVIAAAAASFMTLVEFRRAAFFMSRLSTEYGVESISPNQVMLSVFAMIMFLAIPASVFFLYQARRNEGRPPIVRPVNHVGEATS